MPSSRRRPLFPRQATLRHTRVYFPNAANAGLALPAASRPQGRIARMMTNDDKMSSFEMAGAPRPERAKTRII